VNVAVRAFLRKFVAEFDRKSRGFTPEERRAAAKRAVVFLQRELPPDQLSRLSGFVREILEEFE
jgi:hypothetical protein